MYYLLVLAVITRVYGQVVDGKRQDVVAEQRQFPQGPQYPFDLQYDFTLLDPQLQYPQIVGGDGARLQPQVLLYPGGAPGQPFLLQPGAPPGNFLIPQPQPGVILRDAPPRPSIFVQGYPKPAHVPPINKDAEEIPTNPAAIPPIQTSGRRPEKLETFDLPEKPDVSIKPEAEEADVLASADRNLAGVPPLKPGHRFFILNGQPLFSNYPLPNFLNSPFQPSPGRFGQSDPNLLLYRHNGLGPAFLPDGFNNGLPPYKVPVNNFLVRNSITGQINSARPNGDQSQNDIGEQYPQNLISLNRPEGYGYKEGLSLRNQLPIPLQKASPITFLVKAQTSEPERVEPREKDDLKLRPIEVPDEEEVPLYEGNVKPGVAQLDYFRYRPNDDDKESVVIDAKSESEKDDVAVNSENNRQPNKYEEPSISQAQPGAIALAGPGGVAAAAPRGTALTGEKGLAVSSPHATAIAGPTRDQIEDKPINIKKEKP